MNYNKPLENLIFFLIPLFKLQRLGFIIKRERGLFLTLTIFPCALANHYNFGAYIFRFIEDPLQAKFAVTALLTAEKITFLNKKK